MGKSAAVVERDLSSSVCPYERSAGAVILQCRDCPGNGTLSNPRCRAGCLRALTDERGCSSIVMAEYNEIMYTPEAVEILGGMASLLRELDVFCEEKHGMRSLSGLRCEGCVWNPRNLYPAIRKTLFLDLGDCYQRIRHPLLEKEPGNDRCKECYSGVKDRLFLLLYMVDGIRTNILAKALGIVLDAAPEEKGKPKRLKETSSKDLLDRAEKAEVGSLQAGLEKALDCFRKIRPCFSNAWLDPSNPADSTLVQGKKIDGARIRLFHLQGREESFYHLLPQEYLFQKEEVMMMEDMRSKILLHDPSKIMLGDQASIRSYVEDAARRGFIRLLQQRKGLTRLEAASRAGAMSRILARYTAGMGVLEYVLADDVVQDVYVDAPSKMNPMHLTAGVSDPRLVGKLVTNIVLDSREMDTLVSRLRHMSGLPFSEANPVLETDMEAQNTRATIIGPPLSPQGVAAAFRRHSSEPWTLPRLAMKRSLSSLAAGLLWYLVDGQATFIIAGSRGSGKSSLLGSMLFALSRSQRMLIIEDTPELPVDRLQDLGYKAQALNISGNEGRSALKVSLRLGEGALVLGEVRGDDARLLYEAMRTGTAGSTVLGTFHADSPRAVYERVVHDLDIPFQSFSATDVIVIAGLVRPGGGTRVMRRVTHISEVDKQTEGSFRTLMEYDESTDTLVPTDDFFYRSEVISGISRSWGMRMEEAIQEIEARGKIVEALAEKGERHSSAIWTSRAFTRFKDLKENGEGDSFALWKIWFTEASEYE